MQALSKAKVGENYTIQWLFGLPEVVEFLHRHHVEEGGSVQVIQKKSKVENQRKSPSFRHFSGCCHKSDTSEIGCKNTKR